MKGFRQKIMSKWWTNFFNRVDCTSGEYYTDLKSTEICKNMENRYCIIKNLQISQLFFLSFCHLITEVVILLSQFIASFIHKNSLSSGKLILKVPPFLQESVKTLRELIHWIDTNKSILTKYKTQLLHQRVELRQSKKLYT